jgi:uncharacterized membrane protein
MVVDLYPFVFLNLLLSFEAAYTAPIIMMSQNRAAEREQVREISLHVKLDQLRGKELVSVIEAMERQNEILSQAVKNVQTIRARQVQIKASEVQQLDVNNKIIWFMVALLLALLLVLQDCIDHLCTTISV